MPFDPRFVICEVIFITLLCSEDTVLFVLAIEPESDDTALNNWLPLTASVLVALICPAATLIT
ncbi:hypothetical protein WI25_33015 [Burkholderia cepacia]|nr:hypothetical protein WI25_33015 [Burkholderia cepacia]